jgi:Domain of unknown function (DUF4157)
VEKNSISNAKIPAESPGGSKTAAPFFGDGRSVSSLFIQPKLSVNQPGDAYEQEADATADTVMRMPGTIMRMPNPVMRMPDPGFGAGGGGPFFKPSPMPALQRKCAACEEEEPAAVQRKCKNCEEEEHIVRREALEEDDASDMVQRESSADNSAPQPSAAVDQTLASSGQPLDAGTMSFMQERFGQDFSNVQIHNDGLAHQSSADIQAKAYTHGNHIAFGAGEYQPQSESGKHLLAHELTHVVQQASGTSRSIQRKDKDPFALQMSSLCFAPTPIFGPEMAPGLGYVAEKFIEADFVRQMGVLPMLNAYFDDATAGSRDPNLISFLTIHNQNLPPATLKELSAYSGKRPDIITHMPVDKEYYEIKPNSPTGIAAGEAKLDEFSTYVALYGLPYRLGTKYSPSSEINIAKGTTGGIPIRFYLQVEKPSPGLIVYKLCIETDWRLISKVIASIAFISMLTKVLSDLGKYRPPIAPGPPPEPEPNSRPEPVPDDDGGGVPLWAKVGTVGVVGAAGIACVASGVCEAAAIGAAIGEGLEAAWEFVF